MNITEKDLFQIIGELYVSNTILNQQNAGQKIEIDRLNKEKESDEKV